MYFFDSSEINSAIYKSYIEKKSCYLCITTTNFFVNNDVIDPTTQTSVVDKLKFLCKEMENNMFPPNDIQLNICVKCECKISEFYKAKVKLISTLKFWERFFNLTHYGTPVITTNETNFEITTKIEIEESKLTENVYIKEETIVSDETEFTKSEIKPVEQVLINNETEKIEYFDESPATTLNADSITGNVIPVNEITKCNKASLLPINLINGGLSSLPQTSQIKFVNVTKSPGKNSIFNQVDPSIFIRDTINNIYLCLKCKKQFSEMHYLSRHLHIHNRQVGVFSCSVCTAKFSTQYKLDKHMYCHSENAAFKCDKCNLGFSTELRLKRHTEWHLNIKRFACDKCEKRFRTRQELVNHVEVHLGKKHTCDICAKVFLKQKSLEAHVKQHKNPRPVKLYKCEECGEQFRCSVSYKNHERRHNGIKFECAQCDKFYYNQAQLRKHLERHKNIRNFACTVCDKRFYTAQMLKGHAYSHSTKRNFVCEFCGKSYTMKSALYMHSREHAPHKCALCKKAFWVEKNLTIHVQKVHEADATDETTDESEAEEQNEEMSKTNDDDSNTNTDSNLD